MCAEAAAISAGANGLIFLPYIRGGGAPHFDINASGVFLGLGMAHDRRHMLRALYEGICFNMRWLYDLYEELDIPIFSLNEIRAIGGGALNDLWMQIYADVTGVKFSRVASSQQMTALGAAIMGGIGAGIWNDYQEATALIKVEKTFVPDPKNHEVYNALYPIYRSAYSDLKDLYKSLTEYVENR
jgi:xylulokinase